MSPIRKRVTIALVSAAVLGVGVASAATLGTVSSSSLGAGDTIVASCDTDGVSIAYTNTYDPATGRYNTTGVTISGIATACNTRNLAVTLKDGTNAAIGSGTATVGGVSQTVSLTPAPAAAAVVGASVVISG